MFQLPREDVVNDMHDHEFAHAYLEDQANLRIAAQVRTLRRQRGWTQEDLAQRAGIKQSRISKIEGADFESVTLTTLRKLAQAFDVHARVSFSSVASALVDFSNLSKEGLEVEGREESLSHLAALRSHPSFIGSAAPAPRNSYSASTAGAMAHVNYSFDGCEPVR
jgi:transcriptional regulator with XRE-family HTH domain